MVQGGSSIPVGRIGKCLASVHIKTKKIKIIFCSPFLKSQTHATDCRWDKRQQVPSV